MRTSAAARFAAFFTSAALVVAAALPVFAVDDTSDPSTTTTSSTYPDSSTTLPVAEESTTTTSSTLAPSTTSSTVEPSTTTSTVPSTATTSVPSSTSSSPPNSCVGYVALTFDDGPVATHTNTILDVLRRYGVRAVFLPNGYRVVRQPGIIRRISAEGHQLLNHGWSHSDMAKIGPAAAVDELVRTHEAMVAAGGSPQKIYRPPYGATNASVRAATAAAGFVEIRWTVDSGDYRGWSSKKIRDHVVSSVRPGSNILMHDHFASTAAALPGIIEGITAKGLCFGSINGQGKVTSAGWRGPITPPSPGGLPPAPSSPKPSTAPSPSTPTSSPPSSTFEPSSTVDLAAMLAEVELVESLAAAYSPGLPASSSSSTTAAPSSSLPTLARSSEPELGPASSPRGGVGLVAGLVLVGAVSAAGVYRWRWGR